MFDPFFTTKSTGRGLGLAVVQGIVRILCGAISITSERDKGTTVQVLLPCAKIDGRTDAILLDMTLLGPGGREIVAEAAKVKPEIKVILTSAYSQEMIEGSITAPQIRGFIRKPFPLVDSVEYHSE